MTRLGLIARCDRGGLANQTWEIWRHLEPERTLLVQLGRRGRGEENPSRFDHGDVRTTDGDRIPDQTLLTMMQGLDVLLAVETSYNRDAADLADAADCRFMLIANPELYAGYRAHLLAVPTRWELNRMPTDVHVLPHPVCRDLLPYRRRTEALVFYHPEAPAMLDRNGTKIVLAALAYIDEPCEVIIRSHRRPPWRTDVVTIGNVTARWIRGHTDHYWESYPPEADVIVLPRRYGGLCLPVQEAAALGMPALMTDLPPQRGWPHVVTFDAGGATPYPMKGGAFDVYQPSPRNLAEAMTGLVRNPDRIADLSASAHLWADDRSWPSLLPHWRELIDAA